MTSEEPSAQVKLRTAVTGQKFIGPGPQRAPSLILIPLSALATTISPSLIQMQRAASNRMRADLIQKASLKISASRI